MATELATAYVQLVPSFRGASRTISDEMTKQGAAGGKKFAKGFEGQTSKMGKKVAIGAALVVAGAAVAKFATSSANAYKSIGMDVAKLSRLTGMSTEQASKLRFEFQQTGIDANRGAQGVVIFSKKVAASKDGMKDFGFQTRDANGNLLPMSELLANAADHLAKTKTATDRTAESMKLFGRGGADMAKLLGKGSDAMAKLGDEAGRYGLILTEKNLNAVKQATENERKQKAAMQGLKVQIGEHVLPIMTKWTEFMAKEIPRATKFMEDHEGAVKVVGTAVGVTTGLFVAYKGAMVVQTIASGAWSAATGIATGAQTAFNYALDQGAVSAYAAAGSLGTLSIAAGGAGALFLAWKSDADRSARSAAELRSEMESLSGAMKAQKKSLTEVRTGWVATQYAKHRDALKRLGISVKDLDRLVGGSHKNWEQWRIDQGRAAVRSGAHRTEMIRDIKTVQNLRSAYTQTRSDLKAQSDAARELAGSTNKAAGATQSLADKWYAGAGKAIADATNKYKAWRTEVDNAWAALKRLTDYKLGIVDANLAYAQAVADQQAGVKERGTVLGYGSQAGRDNIAAAEASRRAILQQAEALRTEKDGAKKAADFIAAHVVQLNAQELAMGYTRDQVNLLNAAMGMTPSQVITEMVTKPRIDKQRKAIDDYNAWVAAHPAYHITNDQIIAHGGYGTVDPALGPAAANAGTYSSVPTGASIGSGGGVSGSGGVHRSGGKSIGTVNIYGAKDDRQMVSKLLWAQGR